MGNDIILKDGHHKDDPKEVEWQEQMRKAKEKAMRLYGQESEENEGGEVSEN